MGQEKSVSRHEVIQERYSPQHSWPSFSEDRAGPGEVIEESYARQHT